MTKVFFKAFPAIEFPASLIERGFQDESYGSDEYPMAALELDNGNKLLVFVTEADHYYLAEEIAATGEIEDVAEACGRLSLCEAIDRFFSGRADNPSGVCGHCGGNPCGTRCKHCGFVN